jgi:hypothetical protein
MKKFCGRRKRPEESPIRQVRAAIAPYRSFPPVAPGALLFRRLTTGDHMRCYL